MQQHHHRVSGASLLRQLRSQMRQHHIPLLLVPSSDSHNSEYVAAKYKRRSFISHFNGSAGTALILLEDIICPPATAESPAAQQSPPPPHANTVLHPKVKAFAERYHQKGAFLWTDGRYWLEAEESLFTEFQLMRQQHPQDPSLEEFVQLYEQYQQQRQQPPSPEGGEEAPLFVSVDPFVCTIAEWERMGKEIKVAPAPDLVLPLMQQYAPSKTNMKEHSVSEEDKKALNVLYEELQEAQARDADGPTTEYNQYLYERPVSLAGASRADKWEALRQEVRETHFCDVVVLSALDEIAWLTNLRGGRDVPYNPVFYSYALVDFQDPDKAIRVYVHAEKINESPTIVAAYGRAPTTTTTTTATETENTKKDVNHNLVFLPYEQLAEDIAQLGRPQTDKKDGANAKRKALVDERQTSEGIRRLLEQHHIPYKRVKCGPLQTLKAKKNKAELEGFRACHVRDGAHLTRYLAWLQEHAEKQEGTFFLQHANQNPPSHTHPDKQSRQEEGEVVPLTEYTAAVQLERFRAEDPHFIQLSFETISSVGANGAFVHYSASKHDCAAILPQPSGTSSSFPSDAPADEKEEKKAEQEEANRGIYLVDSGAQYTDGTTDVTRTVFLPSSPKHPRPTPYQQKMYTHVLKGHILLHRTTFPDNNRVTGHRLDTLARWPLWQYCQQDYAHGTGHGVGSLLNVHEGPHGIGSAPAATEAALQEGYITSNEPGYYEAGAFGIRIENLEEVVAAPPPPPSSDHPHRHHNSEECAAPAMKFLGLRTLTMAPYCRDLIEVRYLTPEERDCVNAYHAEVRQCLTPLLEKKKDARALAYLHYHTEPL